MCKDSADGPALIDNDSSVEKQTHLTFVCHMLILYLYQSKSQSNDPVTEYNDISDRV